MRDALSYNTCFAAELLQRKARKSLWLGVCWGPPLWHTGLQHGVRGVCGCFQSFLNEHEFLADLLLAEETVFS